MSRNALWLLPILAMVSTGCLNETIMHADLPDDSAIPIPTPNPPVEDPSDPMPDPIDDGNSQYLPTPIDRLEAKITPTGLKYWDIQVGDGGRPAPQAKVTVHYSGWLTDGTLFDSSVLRGQSASFDLQDVIRGWREGVASMNVGGVRQLEIPPALGYGESDGPGRIPANATLIYEIELLAAEMELDSPPDATKHEGVVATTTESGLSYWDLNVGSGGRPTVRSAVTVQYTGWLTDGTVFDSTVYLGAPYWCRPSQVISGLAEGVWSMNVGGKRRLEIPPALAYGERGFAPTIPPNATLIFEVDLLAADELLPSDLNGMGESGCRPSSAKDMVGTFAPTFEMSTVGGAQVSNATLRESVTVLDFIAQNCGFSKKQLPRLESIRADYAERQVRFVAVHERMRIELPEQEIRDGIASLGWQGELVLDPTNAVGNAFAAYSYPTLVVLGTSGGIEAVIIGNASDLETQLQIALDRVLSPTDLVQEPIEFECPEIESDPAMPSPQDWLGQRAPLFRAETVDGVELSTYEESTVITVLDFVAMNDAYGKRQMPRLESIRSRYVGSPIRFVAVSQTMLRSFSLDEVLDTIGDVGFRGEIVYNNGDNSIGSLFHVSAYPNLVILGPNQTVEAVITGNVSDFETQLTMELDRLLAQ